MTHDDAQPRRPFRPPDYRGRRRAAQHALAESGVDQSPPQTLPDDPLIPRGEPVLIDNPTAFADLIDELRAARRFSYDSEFIGEQSYHPKLCLIQVATVERVALIDPLAGFDVIDFWRLVADPSIEKIVHAGGQDVEPVVRHLGVRPMNVFDTQIAAGFAGMRYPISLAGMIGEFLGVELGKGSKFSQWDHRPLSAKQHRYAADDVRFLLAIRDRLRLRLDGFGNTASALQECDAQCEPAIYRFDPRQQALRVRGTRYMDAPGMAVLMALVSWRDALARAADVPPRTYLKDGLLLEMSRNPPRHADDFLELKHFPRPIQREQGASLLELIADARRSNHAAAPADAYLPEETPEEKAMTTATWEVIQQACKTHGIDPAIYGSRREISHALRRLARGDNGVESRLLRGWRETLAGAILRGG